MPSRSGDMAVYWLFKMAAVYHVLFLKVQKFTCPYPSESICTEIAHVDVTFSSGLFLFWCIRVCVFVSGDRFNERNAFLAAFQVLQHVLHFNFSVITCKINFDWFRAVRHPGFVIRLFGPPTKCILVVSVTVQNLVWIGAVVSIIYKF